MIKTHKDLQLYLRKDFDVQKMEHPFFARFSFGENYAMYKYIANLRYLEYYINKKRQIWDYPFYIYRMLKHRRNCLKYQINISPNTIGYGLLLIHPGFRRLGGPYIKIGNNCTILPMVLIGKRSPDVMIENYIIGDNCYIGVGALIMGPVEIGNNVTIGAGAVVTKNIPDNAVVVGNPARIIRISDEK